MYKEKIPKEIYEKCEEEGSFIPLAEIDIEKIKSMRKIALIDFETSKEWIKNAKKESNQWNAIFKINYDVLHMLLEAFVIFDKFNNGIFTIFLSSLSSGIKLLIQQSTNISTHSIDSFIIFANSSNPFKLFLLK